MAVHDGIRRALDERLGAGVEEPEVASEGLRLLAHHDHPGRFCRVRSYLVSARNHGLLAIDAIRAALTGKPWLPVPAIG
jgi:hypothetical protein